MKTETKVILIMAAIIAGLAVSCVIGFNKEQPLPVVNGKLDSIRIELNQLANAMQLRNDVIESLIVHKKLIVVPYTNLKDSSDAAVQREFDKRIPK